MGNYITTALTICNQKQASEVVAFATNLTQKVSMEVLGFDFTDPANHNDYRSFSLVDSNRICWDQYTSYDKLLNLDYFIDEIAHHFPDIEFIREDYWEGPLSNKEYIKGDYRIELVRQSLYVGVDNQEAFVKLAEKLKEQQSYPFFVFNLEERPISKVESDINDIIDRISKIVPNQNLYCVVKTNYYGGNYYSSKGVFNNGRIDWENVTYSDNEAVWKTEKDWDDHPNEIVFNCLFDDSYRDEIMAQIKKEWEERQSKQDENDDLPF